jgi:general secretion pathway protein F
MTAYRYRALNTEGKLQKGVLEGDSERQVRSNLRAQKLRPLEVSEANQQSSGGPAFGGLFRGRISNAELTLVTRQLATLVMSSLPIDECLQAVAQQTRKARLKGLLLQVRSRVSEGHNLAYAMSEFPNVFNEMYCAMVRAGEHAGFLGPVLEQLADYNEQRQYTQQKMKMAMIYPFILMGVAVAVVVALMVFVVPELIGIFAHTNAELPLLTRILIASSDFIRDWGIWALIAVVALGYLVRTLLKNEARRRNWHQILLKIPGILMASGVPLLESLRIAGEVLTNKVLRESSLDVAERVQEGSSLHRALDQSGHFPPMMVHMVASGEASGELETMLERSATNQERELEMTLGTMMGIFEPMIIIFMGGMVLGIVLAILLPIFKLNTMVN